MKHTLLMLFLCVATGLCMIASLASAQEQAQTQLPLPKLRGYFTVRKPAQGIDIDTIKSAATTTATLPIWSFDARSSRDGHDYQGVMVGRDPFNNPGSVSVPTCVVPLIIKTNTVAVRVNSTTGIITTAPGVRIFDPTVADTNCLKAPNNVPTKLFAESPIFKPATFSFGGMIVGTTQYSDAFQRGNFWKVLGSDVEEYHVLLGPVKFLAPIVLNVPAIYGTAIPTKISLFPDLPIACGPLGIVDGNWFDSLLTGSIIPALASKGVNPTSFPIFLVHNVVWASPVTNRNTCCVLGYHGITGFPLPIQTYSPGDFDSTGLFRFSDAAVASHEVGEWMDDPYVINELTPWGHIGEFLTSCTSLLEVGDPLDGNAYTEYPPIVMPNGFTYHLQELAFFSWFFGPPSIGIHGWFSDNATFLTDAGPPCH